MHINGIDPGFANDILPLVMTSLSQRIDEVRVMEIADYSTYYQPVVMNDIFGFGKPMDEPGGLFAPRSEEHTSELQSRQYLVCRLLLEKKKKNKQSTPL